ncbi:2-dehydropantoate 2-reductase [Rhizobium sp. P38BS-XIX]|uniref:ketopantoate reductase family protein n=1 Tax=Rhizobium sp. P38BS-XIX TaxID=2726740 RepID=UPI001456FA98|nr:2-dehydropantoate 2-reductase [Rhizobium sp. P38BS-XIX]NLS00751.1 2-dehydropantoate 2-reductase [Rhizobium sp. P38BS-XIX]
MDSSHPKQANEFADTKICVAGMGAIGIGLAARMRQAGFPVCAIARGDNLTSIRDNGIHFIDADGDHHVYVDAGSATDFPAQDIVFLCPKSQDLPALAASIKPLLHQETLIVPVINGIPWWYFDGDSQKSSCRPIHAVDPQNSLRRDLPSSQIIGTTTVMTIERVSPGVARTFNPLKMTIGEIDNRDTDRVRMLERILLRAGIETRVTDRIRDAVWTKVVRNLISNPMTAITGATLFENFADNDLAGISRQMLYEVLPVIAAYGARIEVDPKSILESGRAMGPVKTSMLQDLERGSPLELAAICDAVIELAEIHGIPMPVTRAITGLARFRGMKSHRSVAA